MLNSAAIGPNDVPSFRIAGFGACMISGFPQESGGFFEVACRLIEKNIATGAIQACEPWRLSGAPCRKVSEKEGAWIQSASRCSAIRCARCAVPEFEQ